MALHTRRKEMGVSSKKRGIEAETVSTQAVSAESPPRDEEIRRRAYEIYLERGEQPGRDLDDWLQAERELERGVLTHAQAG